MTATGSDSVAAPPRGVGRGWLAPAVCAAAGALACASMIGLEPNLVEEGLVVHFAQRVAHGEHLYRDMVFFSGPLPFEALGLLFRIFGENLLLGRWVMVLLEALTTAAVFDLARRAGAGSLAWLAAALVAATPVLLFPFFSMYYYTPIAYELAVLATWAALRGVRRPGWAIAAGALVACVALCKQTLGVLLVPGLGACLLVFAAPQRRLRPVLAFAGGGALVTAATLALYGSRGDLPALWNCLVTVPLSLEKQYGSPYMNFWPPGRLAPEILSNQALYVSNLYLLHKGLFTLIGPMPVLGFQLLYALPLLGLAGVPLARWRGPLPEATWFHSALLLAMASNVFPRSDWGHLVIARPAAGVQTCLLLATLPAPARLLERLPPRLRQRLAAWLAELVPLRLCEQLSTRLPERLLPWLREHLYPHLPAALLAGAVLAVTAPIGLWIQHSSGPPTWGPRVPLRPVSAALRDDTIPRVIRYLRQRVKPGEPIFVARAEPLLYFATDTTNPTRFGGVLTTMRHEQEEEILAALHKVNYVVMSEIDQPLWTYYYDELPRVKKYLERHFRIAPYYHIDYYTWATVLARGPDRGETLIDLIDARPGARAWTRDRDGHEHVDEEPPPKMAARGNRRGLPVRLGVLGGGIDYEIDVPPNAHFDGGVGLGGMRTSDNVYTHPKRTRVEVSVLRDGVFVPLASEVINDEVLGGGRWEDVDVDLSRFAGQHITLRLEHRPQVRYRWPTLAWWGSPRIAGPAETEEPVSAGVRKE